MSWLHKSARLLISLVASTTLAQSPLIDDNDTSADCGDDADQLVRELRELTDCRRADEQALQTGVSLELAELLARVRDPGVQDSNIDSGEETENVNAADDNAEPPDDQSEQQ